MPKESQNSSARMFHPVSIKRLIVKKSIQGDNVLIGETTAGIFPVLLLRTCSWSTDQLTSPLIPLSENLDNNRITTT